MHLTIPMAKWNCPRLVRSGAALAASLLIVVALVAPAHPQPVPQVPKNPAAASAGTQPAAPASVKPDPKRAKEAYDEGLLAEKKQDWSTAFENYSDAVRWAPDNHKYLMSRELARSQLVQTKMDAAERDAISGKFEDAERELESAHSLDPTNTVVSERLAEISSIASTAPPQIPAELPLAGEVHLAYQEGKRTLDYRGDTRGAYQEVARQFGVEVAFDEDLRSRTVRLQVEDVDFSQAMQILGDMTGTFWRPLTKRLFFVANDTPEKRRVYDVSVVRTILLPASDTADQMTEVLRVVRDIAGITRSNLDTSGHSITLRASPRAIAIASDLVDDLEQPSSELVLEIEVLEVDRNYAHTLGITPPQTAHVYSINSQEVQEAQQSVSGLLSVLEQIFGTPSPLSGLTPSQVQAELASGQISPSTFPFVVFGGGLTTFLGTAQGAAANLSEMLSLVQHGRRILLRAEDGQPATFFVGERYPVALGAYSPNLTNSVAAISSSEFPITDYPTGKSPSFVATASLRNNGIKDLIIANSVDDNLSVFLGNASATSSSVGDGTFATQVITALPPGDTDPVWIATGTFNTTNSFVDLAVANKTSNTVTILLGDGLGDFPTESDLNTGLAPVSIVTGDFDGDGNLDLAVADQGDNTIDIFFGNGDGTFVQPPEVIHLPAGFQISALATGTFDTTSHLDTMGHLDLAVADKGNNSVSVLLGVGGRTNTFPTHTEYPVGVSPVWVSAADFNGDGFPDLAVANNGAPTSTLSGNSVSILFGNGDGTFNTSTEASYPAGNGPTSIAVAQYALSGLNDLAVTDQTDNAVSVLFNTGAGVFSLNHELSLSPDTDPVSIVSADFNGDTRPDAAVVNDGSNDVSVILNELNFSNTASNLLATPTSGAYPSIQYMDIGIKVKAMPRVHPDGDVTLKLEMEMSSLTNLSNNGNPVINNDSVEQTVRVKENETATLAGILEPQVTSAINGTPGLADLPVIGWLGKNQNTQTQDTELLIMITPRMIELTPHKNHVIYAGQGSPEGPTGGGNIMPEPQNVSSPNNGGQGQRPPAESQPPPEGPRYTPQNPPQP
ncbi:MAG: FG-GAP-like repeat-containing protein [Candidatus Acidiferrales bacterium]